MKKLILLGFLSTTLAFACGGGDGGGGGGGSGVDGSLTLGELDDSEITDICEYTTSLIEPRTITCEDGEFMLEAQSVAECVAAGQESRDSFPDCPVTVAEAEACFEAQAAMSDDQWCTLDFPEECEALQDPLCG